MFDRFGLKLDADLAVIVERSVQSGGIEVNASHHGETFIVGLRLSWMHTRIVMSSHRRFSARPNSHPDFP
jgi:hypothetical protein